MARKQERITEGIEEQSTDSAGNHKLTILNRRNYVKLGFATTAAILLGNAGNAPVQGQSTTENTIWTDFSEGAL